eukprot:2908327-Rhodomonas_salina.1
MTRRTPELGAVEHPAAGDVGADVEHPGGEGAAIAAGCLEEAGAKAAEAETTTRRRTEVNFASSNATSWDTSRTNAPTQNKPSNLTRSWQA